MAQSKEPTTPGEPFRSWLADPKTQAERLRAQIDEILTQLEGSALASPRDDQGLEGTLDYLFHQGRILVRDVDLERVRAVENFPSDAPVVDSIIDGVTALGVADTQLALDVVNGALGAGVARPDHVLYVAPATCCPATEPVPAPQSNPDPDVRRDPSSSGSGVVLSVVDTGWIPGLDNAAHPWLAGVTGDVETVEPADLGPYAGHGSFVAGVARCLAPEAQIRVEGFLTHGGAVFESTIVKQLDQAMQTLPDVISMSAGCVTHDNLPPLAFEALYQKRLRHLKGTVLVCAAGNDGSRRPFWPAASPWAVSVGALDRDGSRAGFSNFGSWVDVYALGTDVVNAYPNGTFRFREPPASTNGEKAEFTTEMAIWSGTSFATPLFAGMIAARMSRNGQSARQAADSLLRIARAHAQPGTGPVAEADTIGDVDPGH
ncbi:MAG: S8/S53 family peptidase [Actinomycetota bacterium]